MRFFFIYLLITILSMSVLSSQEESFFQFNMTGRVSKNFILNDYFYQQSTMRYSKITSDIQASELIRKIKIANTALSIISIVGYSSNVILGAFVLAEKFQDQPYWNAILYTHIPIGVTSGLLAATVISLGYVDIGLKNKYHLIPNKANTVSIYINTCLAAAEIGFVVANLITSRLNPEAAKWIGLAHAITTASLLVGITVQFGTSFIKNK